MAKPITSNEHHPDLLRNANEAYQIDFEQPYLISCQVLKLHAEKKDIKYKGWNWPESQLLSLHDGLLVLETKNESRSFRLNLQIERDQFTVSCSCGQQVHKLCCHAYGTLHSMARFSPFLNLESFCRDGLLELATKYPRNFNVIDEKRMDMRVKVPQGFGEIFLPGNTDIDELSKRLALGRPPATHYKSSKPIHLALGYVVIYYRGSGILPFLLPYYGRVNKAGTEIKFFDSFMLEATELPELSFSDEQRVLNSICFEMYRLTTSLSKKISMEAAHQKDMHTMFHLWEKAVKILETQKYTHFFHCANLVRLRHKPRKQNMIPCNLSPARPEISFRLQRKGDINKCQMVMKSGKDDLIVPDRYDLCSFLLLNWDTDTVYLFGSIRDAVLLNWFGKAKCLTVFKPHFDLFRDGVLRELSHYYPFHYKTADNKNIYQATKQLQLIKRLVNFKMYRDWMVFTPCVEYDDGSVLSVLTNGIGWLTETDGKEVLVQRDKKYERQFKDFFQKLHPTFQGQDTSDGFHLFWGGVNEEEWFEKINLVLKQEGIPYQFESTEAEKDYEPIPGIGIVDNNQSSIQ